MTVPPNTTLGSETPTGGGKTRAAALIRAQGDEVKISRIGEMLDSGGTGGGILVDGQACSGFWSTYDGFSETGKSVVFTLEHLYNDAGILVRASATMEDGEIAEGSMIEKLIDELTKYYAEV